MDPERARVEMQKAAVDALVAMSPENVFYASGLRTYLSTPNKAIFNSLRLAPGSAFVVTTSAGDSTLVCTAMWASMARADCWVQDMRFYPAGSHIDRPQGTEFAVFAKSSFEALGLLLGEKGLRDATLAIERDFVPVSLYDRLTERFPKARFVDAQPILSQLRRIKSKEEIDRIRNASQATARAIEVAMEAIRPGVRETELLAIFKMALMENDCEWNTTTIGAGPNSAEVQNIASDYELRPGDLVRFDVGGSYQGYCSDLSRCASVGKPPEDIARLFKAHLEGQSRVVEAMTPGGKLADLFRLGIETVHASGHPGYAPKRVGHAIGLTAHEHPDIGPSTHEVLEPGMVLTVEVPFYIAGLAGLNIENDVVITEDGCEILDRTDKGLRICG